VAERRFSPAEVETLIPRLSTLMQGLMRANEVATAARERLRAEQRRVEEAGGGVIDRAAWQADTEARRQATEAVQEGIDEILRLGGIPKDLALGLVDFPHEREGREVNLCWRYGERAIRFWHGLDEGYASRKPL
jgi:hypothetical protein